MTGAQAYRLTIATTPGAVALVNSGILAANATSYRVPALPTGQTLYARLAWEIAGSWSDYQDVSFTAAPNPVAFTHPTQGQTAGQQPGHVHLEHQSGRDRLPALGRHQPRLREPAEIRIAERPAPPPTRSGAPGRSDAVGPDLHRGRQRLG